MPGQFWQDSHRRPDVLWPGRGIAWEVGPRAWRLIQIEDRRDEHGGFFPPALEEMEEVEEE